MVQSVELLLDPASEAAVRAEWDRLLDASLPSLGRHTGPGNRPHVTLAVAKVIAPPQESALSGVAQPMPLPVLLGAPLVFGAGPFVLARSVVPSVDLLTFQARVVTSLGDAARPFAHQQGPGRWTGHVTLARKLSASDLMLALGVLRPLPVIEATAVSLRRWDGDARIEWTVRPGAPSQEATQARLGN
ncbi:2'-5' RNA ligase [Nakamurella panacisegetis]|uniref:2'-5' RNA ligase n=1 Tax=Nakamurella panacisegetis TaxID=1090615 RepID=A0A1H0QKN1_9ACTN|nr:2'-5' RNA ligase family protein [Nakamurella panacisegetis]SDP17625.1 2'-5' RNA ligase [Nakamurella panacisegetis]